MLFRKIITGYSEKHSKYINAVVNKGEYWFLKSAKKSGIFGIE